MICGFARHGYESDDKHMSTDADSRTSQPGASIHVDHWCCVRECGKWGCFGFSKGSSEPKWWCWEHYPHKPNQARSQAVEIVEAIGL